MTSRVLVGDERVLFLELASECDSVFASEPFVSAFGEDLLLFGIFNKQSKLCGGFVAMKTRLRGIPALIDPSYAPHCGLFISGQEISGFKKNQYHKDIMAAIATVLNEQKVKVVSLSFPPAFNDLQPMQWQGFELRVKYTYRLKLQNDTSESIDNYDPKLRSSLQKYMAGEVKVEEEVRAEELTSMVSQLQKNKNVRKKQLFLNELADSFLKKNAEKSIACKLSSDRMIGNITFCIHGKSTAYYLLGALNKEVGVRNAGAICLHHCITVARRKNIDIFDFEGSSIPAIESFFRSFGAELTPYYNVVKCPWPLRAFLK